MEQDFKARPATIQERIRDMIRFIGDDPEREGLIETPDRIIRSWGELFSGYQYDTPEKIGAVLKVFEEGACDEMVVLKDIHFVSFCEHHWLPFTGLAHVAYIPDGKIVGLSKLARIVDIFGRRLQVQERMTEQITSTLQDLLKPKGVGCIIEGAHSCMSCRGVLKQRATMITSSLTGDFKTASTKAEFMSLVGK